MCLPVSDQWREAPASCMRHVARPPEIPDAVEANTDGGP